MYALLQLLASQDAQRLLHDRCASCVGVWHYVTSRRLADSANLVRATPRSSTVDRSMPSRRRLCTTAMMLSRSAADGCSSRSCSTSIMRSMSSTALPALSSLASRAASDEAARRSQPAKVAARVSSYRANGLIGSSPLHVLYIIARQFDQSVPQNAWVSIR